MASMQYRAIVFMAVLVKWLMSVWADWFMMRPLWALVTY